MKKILILAAAIISAGMMSGVASIEQMENQKAKYENAAEEARVRSEWLQGKINSVSEIKRVLDEEAAAAVADFDAKQNNLNETLSRIEGNELKLLENSRDYEKNVTKLEKRIRDIYINGQLSYLDVMFGANDFGDFLTRMDLLKRVLVNDADLISATLQAKTEIENLGVELEEDKRLQAEQLRLAEKAKNKKLKKVADQQLLLDRMENDKAVYDRRYDEMMAASKQVEKLIQESKYRIAAEKAAKEQAAAERAARAERQKAAREMREAQLLAQREREKQLRLEEQQRKDAAREKALREKQELQQKWQEKRERATQLQIEKQLEKDLKIEREKVDDIIIEIDDDDVESFIPEGTGEMLYPLIGPITSEFGWRTHPIFGGSKFHSGIDIGGDYGMEIRAARGGVVSHAGWIDGYGNTIMIDHGGGLVTLYGHNQSFAVSVGKTVKQGEVIAYCGSTGNSTGPHCHFEVRLNGEPVSPYDYL